MNSDQKINERKRWNAPFLRAFNYLLEEGYAITKGELCKKIGIEAGLVSKYTNGTKRVSVDTMNALARVSNGKLNVNYMLGKSEYMLIENVPDEEIINIHNPDHEVIEKRKQEKQKRTASSIDESSQMNASISAYIQLTNRLTDDLKKKEIEMADKLAEKDARIAELKETIADKEEIIKARDARIVALERELAAVKSGDLQNYPFAFGAAEQNNQTSKL